MAANDQAFRDTCRRQVWVAEGWVVIADAKLRGALVALA